MALGIGALVNQIQSSVNGLLDKLAGNTKDVVTYPKSAEFKAIQSQFASENWSKLTFPYTFSVVSLNGEKIKDFSDFQLPLAPQSINQSEDPAIVIKASQGGTTVSHSGLGYKALNIQGTTGLAPFRGDGGADRKTGEAIFQPNDLKHKSGYEVFIHLRNWFRTYYQYKKVKGTKAKDLRLVFKNYKDGEFLIVELLSFEMDRQAAKPHLYDYKLQFKVISHYEFLPAGGPATTGLAKFEEKLNSALNSINNARGVFLRSQGILRQIESTYEDTIIEPMRQTTLMLKAFLGVPVVAADISSRTIVNTVSTAKALYLVSKQIDAYKVLKSEVDGAIKIAKLDELTDKKIYGIVEPYLKTLQAAYNKVIQQGPSALNNLGAILTTIDISMFPEKTNDAMSLAQTTALDLPQTFFKTFSADLDRIKSNAEDFFNLGSPQYDAIFGRTSTFAADSTKETTDEEYQVLNAFNDLTQGLNSLLSVNELFKSTIDTRIQDMNTRFSNSISLESSSAVKQIKLPANVTLEKLAQLELGDASKWGEIVEVNNLKPPFISQNRNETRPGVLRPGQNILIPVSSTNGFSQVPVGSTNKLTTSMNDLEKSLGVDFRLGPDFDLVLSAGGDLELVAGTDNIAQATILKLSYEPGDVMAYPTLGTGLIIGTKFPPISEIHDRVISSLMQDSRIDKVADLVLQQDNSALSLSFSLYIKNVDIPVPVSIKL